MRRYFRPFEAPEPDAARFRARQVQAVLHLTPLAMTIQLSSALILPMLLWGQLPAPLLLGWAALVALLAAFSVRAWWRARRAPPRTEASPRGLRHVLAHAVLLGGLWGALPLMTLGRIDADSVRLVDALVTGMVCAGGFALVAVPQAGTAYVLLVGTGAALALLLQPGRLGWAMGLQLAGYTAIVLYTLWQTARTLGARMVAEMQAAHQGEVIALLLRDFEDHAADLLWELDAQDRFVHLSPRMARALGLAASDPADPQTLGRLAQAVPADDESAVPWRAFVDALAARQPFRDLTIALRVAGQLRWWAMSASPLRGSDGRFAGWRGVASDVTERQQALRQLRWLAHNDALTGLVNRRQLREKLQVLLPGDAAAARPLALVLIDLDGFKQVNDTRGHAAGDHILQVFGQRLLGVARRRDTVARLGGDEFAIAVDGAAAERDVAPLLARVLDMLDEPAALPEGSVTLRASLGVALAPRDGHDVDTLLNHADVALYTAKRSGGQRWCVFNPGLAEGGRRRSMLAQALRGALERGELRLEFQPQVHSRDARVHGFEALLRWRHAEHGDVSPAEFVPIAEAAGLMPAIGDWVLEQSCRHAATWPGAPRVAVNVSAVQLGDPAFVPRVLAACAGLARGQLELEITESALIEDVERTVQALGALREHGVPIALDDFGTGYSALGYLRRFPFDTLKIDRSFVRDLAHAGEARVIVDTILAMARALGMSTVAEGVETEAEAQMLRQRGCTLLQGFLISRPLPAARVRDFLQRADQALTTS